MGFKLLLLTFIIQTTALGFAVFAEPARPKSTGAKAYTLSDRLFNSRRLLRFSQLWNLYSTRNLDLPEAERQRLQAIINRTRAPQMHIDMPVSLVTEQIKKDAEELLKALEAEKRKGKNLAIIIANQNYLKNRFLPNLENQKYFSGSTTQFSAELKFMMPTPEPLPEETVEASTTPEPQKPLPTPKPTPALKIYLLPDTQVAQ